MSSIVIIRKPSADVQKREENRLGWHAGALNTAKAVLKMDKHSTVKTLVNKLLCVGKVVINNREKGKGVNSKTAAKTLGQVMFTPDVVWASYNVPDHVKLKWLPVFGLGMEQPVELLEPFHVKEASRADLQCDDVVVVGVRIGISEVLVLLDLPLSSIEDVGLERHSQLHQVDCGGVMEVLSTLSSMADSLATRYSLVSAEVEWMATGAPKNRKVVSHK